MGCLKAHFFHDIFPISLTIIWEGGRGGGGREVSSLKVPVWLVDRILFRIDIRKHFLILSVKNTPFSLKIVIPTLKLSKNFFMHFFLKYFKMHCKFIIPYRNAMLYSQDDKIWFTEEACWCVSSSPPPLCDTSVDFSPLWIKLFKRRNGKKTFLIFLLNEPWNRIYELPEVWRG